MRVHFLRATGALFSCTLLLSAANAALIDRGGGFIYDDVLDITWSQNANINGYEGLAAADAWVDSLSIYDSIRDETWDDWRLPNMDINGDGMVVNCSSVSEVVCRDNEFGYMFHQNGISSSSPGVFTNVDYNSYWSSTPWASDPDFRWRLNFGSGSQSVRENGSYGGWAVLDGDVAASVVPVPAAVWLFGSALVGLGWVRRKKG